MSTTSPQSSWFAEFNRLCWRRFPQLILAFFVWWGIFEIILKILRIFLNALLNDVTIHE